MGALRAVREPGVVVVRLHVPCPAAEVWPALCEPGRLAGWLGEVGAGWPGDARVHLDEADHFGATGRRLVPGELIEFDWRYLSVGRPSRVSWSLRPAGAGTEIVLRDEDAERSPADAAERLGEWSDLAERLAHLLTTGRPGPAPDTAGGSLRLPGGRGDLLAPATLTRWLPIATDGFQPRWFFIVDADGPRRFPVTDWYADPASVAFSVGVPGTVRRTECLVRAKPAGAGTWLSYVHSGWSRLGLPDRRARLLRRRFAATWAASLRLARDLTPSRSTGPEGEPS
jgi:uncharacterized protein YndB with AHSA1/START domain